MQTNSANSHPHAPDLTQARCRFGLLIGSVYRQWRKKVDESFKDQGLTDATRMPLVVLLTHGEAMLQKDLAQALSLDSSSLVRVLAQLREAGYVEWEPHETDRRAKSIRLTDEGRAMAERMVGESLAIEAQILEVLSPAEMRATREALEKIARRLDAL